MRRQVLKTYQRQKNAKLDFSSIQGPLTTKPLEIKKRNVFNDSSDDPLETTFDRIQKELVNKQTPGPSLDCTLDDPFENTFDRILKEYKDKPIPPPIKGMSYISNSETESDSSFLKNLKSKTDDNSIVETTSPKKELKTGKKRDLTKKTEKVNKKPPKLSKINKKKSYKKLKHLAERKQLIDDNSLSFTTVASSIKGNSLNDQFQHSGLKTCSIILEPCDRMLKKQESVFNLKPCSVKIHRLVINSPKTIQVLTINDENAEKKINNSKRQSEENIVKNSKRPRVDELEKSSKKMIRKKSNITSESIRADISSESLQSSKKKLKISFGDIIRQSIGAKENQFKKSRKVPVDRKTTSPSVFKSPMVLKDCNVNLTRIDSPMASFKNRLVSSTPVVRKNGNLCNGSSAVNLEISNIASPIVTSKIFPTNDISNVTSKQFKEASVRLEDITKSKSANLQNNWSANFHENTDNWNNSSDYSAIDWETVSYSESQLTKEPSLQRKFRSFPAEDKLKSTSRRNNSFNGLSQINDSSAKSISSVIPINNQSGASVNGSKAQTSINKVLEVSLEQCNVGTKRFINKSPEYENSVSVSMFDDTKLQGNDLHSSLESSNLPTENKTSMKCPSLSVRLTKLEFTDFSILNQSDCKGFEEKSKISLKKLSPMTSIPSSVVYSIAVEDSIQDSPLTNNNLHEKAKLFESPAFEKSSLRKCLDYDEEPEFQNESDTTNHKESPVKKDKSLDDTKRRCSFDVSVVISPLKLEKSQCSKKNILLNQTRDDNGIETLTIDSDSSLSDESTTNCAIKSNDFEEDNNSLIGSQDLESRQEYSLSSAQNSVEDSLTSPKNKIQEGGQYEKYVKQYKTTDRISKSEVDDAETIIFENNVGTNKTAQRVLKDKQEENRLVTKAVNDSEIKNRETFSRLKDPVRITQRRKNYRNWGWRLSDISENENRNSSKTEIAKTSANDVAIIAEVEENDAESSKLSANDVAVIPEVTENESSMKNNLSSEQAPEQHLFLKPGKSWARSLSILNNIHSETDVDKFSVGKGKKWRHSVYSILDQNKGNLTSCTKKQEISSSQPVSKLKNAENYIIERFCSQGSISPNRISKRISIRVVPDLKRLDVDEDTQFLEAYGIPSSQSTKQTSQRSLSLQETDSFAASPEKNVNLEDSLESHPLATAKDVVLEKCHQSDYRPFNECYPNKFLKHCRKIGEGVYGEVFLHERDSNSSVIKIIPIEGEVKVNGEPQKKFHEILSEIVIAKELHDLRFNQKYNTSSFIEVKNIQCIIGKYPEKLIEHWRKFDDEKKSENDCPSMFAKDQLYISLELGNGGQDLEAFVFQNAEESYSVFIQTAIAMAVAEQSLEFEHRDMHWGNILISRTKKSQVYYKLGDLEINLHSNGLKVAIIDFTLSRMLYKGCCIFNDLAQDPELFTAEGEYQFEIYRLMRDKLGNDWQKFEPYTNILWLHYTLDKMIKAVRYVKKKVTTKSHKNGIERLKELKSDILSYDTAYDLVTKCDKFTILYKDLDSSTDDIDK